MREKVTGGDFSVFGTQVHGDSCTFTFPVRTGEKPIIHLYDRKSGASVSDIVPDDSMALGHVWSVTVSGHDFSKLSYLIEKDGHLGVDPYARVICGREKWADTDRYVKNYEIRGGFSTKDYSWKNPLPKIAAEDLIIYKAHLRGFTMKAPGLSSRIRGTYKGMLEKLHVLADAGFTALELMPVYEFEDLCYRSHLAMDREGNTFTETEEPYAVNYWGYGGGCYFAPKASYFGGLDPDYHMKELVDCAHGLSMKMILEFSFDGTISDDELVDALVFWVRTYHVDGFHLLGTGLPFRRIAENPYLSGTILISDGFSQDILDRQTGDKHLFVTNDGFQYPLRRLQNHMDGNAAEFSETLRRQGKAYGYVNYAASNTGMTLYDAYSYGDKHNEANGEKNRDGNNYNVSSNNGVEGDTKNRIILRKRLTSVRTALLTVLCGQAVPLIMEGDGSLNSQGGNNNPYCQDNEVGWPDFGRKKDCGLMRDYLKAVIAFRKTHSCLAQADPVRFSDYLHVGLPDLSYHGREPWIMGIGSEKKALGILYGGAYGKEEGGEDVLLLFNFYYGEETFALPTLPGGRTWYFVNNTASYDFNAGGLLLENQQNAIVPGGTVTVLIGKSADDE